MSGARDWLLLGGTTDEVALANVILEVRKSKVDVWS